MTERHSDDQIVYQVPLPLDAPILLSQSVLRDRVLLAKDFVTMHGGLMRTAQAPNSSDVVSHVPFLLFPSPFPRRLFDLAISIQQDFHTLVHRMAMDRDFLYNSLKYIIDTDSFTQRLWNLYKEVYDRKDRQPRLYVGTTRNDFMLHKTAQDLEIKQVEYNMTAISFGPLEAVVHKFHRFLIENLLRIDVDPIKVDADDSGNRPGYGLAKACVSAFKAYNELYETKDTCILVVVDDPSRNAFDQRWVELAMYDIDPHVRTMRRTMAELRNKINIDEVEKSGRLIVEGQEIAVVYSRTGYNEDQYDFEAGDWDLVRRPIELSRAAISPCIAHQLVNFKKIQQVITKPGILESFGLNENSAIRMRSTFTKMLGLEFNDDGEKSVEIGLEHSENYVLKPMQEGGGHNYFGKEVALKLQELRDKPERQNFVLMGLINAPKFENVSISPGEPTDKPHFGTFSTELGIYGGFVVVDGQMIENQSLGYVLRSKLDGVNESGIAAGFGRIDSAYFY